MTQLPVANLSPVTDAHVYSLKFDTYLSHVQWESMGLRILFVEDHRDSRRTLSRLLRHFHHTIVSAPDYQTACSILRQAPFDVLLSDICLPDGDGCDLVRQAKSKQPLIAIALTALGSVRDKERGFSGGFDHYLVKPLDVCALCTVLDGILMRST